MKIRKIKVTIEVTEEKLVNGKEEKVIYEPKTDMTAILVKDEKEDADKFTSDAVKETVMTLLNKPFEERRTDYVWPYLIQDSEGNLIK